MGLDRINDFRRRKKTILFVSHDLSTVEKICDLVAWIKNGKIQTIGEPRRVIDAYLSDVAEKQENTFEKRQQEIEQNIVTTTEEEEERRENRWGKRELEIKKVSFKGVDGKEKHVFSPSDGMTIEIEVEAFSELKDFVFGIGVFNSEGICCYGSNTLLEDLAPVSIQGEGKISIRLQRLNLINGTYYLDVAAHKRDGYPYDYHRSLYSFLVSSKHRDDGIYRPEHSWEFSPEIKIKKLTL